MTVAAGGRTLLGVADQTATAFTHPVFVALRPSVAPLVNEVCRMLDPEAPDAAASVALRSASDTHPRPTPVGFWFTWSLTQAQYDYLMVRYAQVMGRALTPTLWGERPDPDANLWLFSPEWSREQVLEALGWALMPERND